MLILDRDGKAGITLNHGQTITIEEVSAAGNGFTGHIRRYHDHEGLSPQEVYWIMKKMMDQRAAASQPACRSRERPEESTLFRDILFLFLKIAAAAAALVLVFTFLYGLHRNADPAMNPAIRDGDLVMFYCLDKNYVVGNVLLLEYDGQRQVRRVIAAAGDTVDITEDGLMINGALQQEPEIYQKTQRYADGVVLPLTVGEGQVFVLGDARENAIDSRVYGVVNVTDTFGKVITILRRRNI